MKLHELQAGQGGWRTLPARAFLRVVSWGWALGNGLRQRLFDWGLRRARRLSVPVVSIGNIAVGGTGKSPFVATLCSLLLESGTRPAVVSRGYGAAPGARLNDEGMELERRFGDRVVQAQGASRFNVGRSLLTSHPDTQVILLDDGFQHRQLHRDLDIVLIDATLPWGHGAFLPRGRLRESPRALRRADVVVLSKCEGISKSTLARIEREIQAHTSAHLVRAHMVVRSLEAREGVRSLSVLEGARVAVACAVGNPRHVVATIQSLGAEVVEQLVVGDHDELPQAPFDALQQRAAAGEFEWVLVTSKDAVKLGPLPAHVGVIHIDCQVTQGLEELAQALRRELGLQDIAP